MAIVLSDDGTMDTVLRCDECGEEFRFTYDPGPDTDWTDDRKEALQAQYPEKSPAQIEDLLNEELYGAWIDSCIEEIEGEHECPERRRRPVGRLNRLDHAKAVNIAKACLAVAKANHFMVGIVNTHYSPDLWDMAKGVLIEWESTGKYSHAVADRTFMVWDMYRPKDGAK